MEDDIQKEVNEMIEKLVFVLNTQKASVGVSAMIYLLVTCADSKEIFMEEISKAWDFYEKGDQNETRN